MLANYFFRKFKTVVIVILATNIIHGQSFVTVLDKTLSDFSEMDLTYVNNMLQASSELEESVYKIVKLQNPYFLENEGNVQFSISDSSIPDITLTTQVDSFTNSSNFIWRGISSDGTFSMRVISQNNVLVASIYNGLSNALQIIIPLDNGEGVMIESQPPIITCSTGSQSILSETSVDCDENSSGIINVLFLLTPESSAWLGNNVDGHLDLMISEFEDVLYNSQIGHKVNYNVAELSSEVSSSNICQTTVEDLLSNSEAQELRDAYGADCVVYLPLVDFVGDIACAA